MNPQFDVPKAIVGEWNGAPIHDFGACTAEQLLFGRHGLQDPAYSIFAQDSSPRP
jgi:hypothetical protein